MAHKRLNAREYSQAIPLLERIRKEREARLGHDHPDGRCRGDAGNLAFFTGDPAKAISSPSPRRLPQEPGANVTPGASATMSRLAAAEEALKHSDRAASQYQEILGRTEPGTVPPQPDRLIALTALVKRHRSRGEYASAIPLQAELVEIRRRDGGDLAYDYTLALSELGESYIEAKDYVKAEALLSQALVAQKNAAGERHQEAILTLVRLALGSLESGDFATAEARYKKYLELADQATGKERVLRVMARSALGAFYQRRKDYARAEAMLRQACVEQRAITGEDDPAYAAPLHALGVLHDEMKEVHGGGC